ncbi:hypothetical protein EV424DRAFT_1327344, partial [Suillus variegatus]
SNLTILAVVSVTSFIDSNGKLLTNISTFAKVLDYIAIMDYAWLNAGMPVGQIVLDVTSYRHSYSIKPSDASCLPRL